MLWVRPPTACRHTHWRGRWAPPRRSGPPTAARSPSPPRIDPNGGAAISICDNAAGPPGSWGLDNVILLTAAQRIAKVPATGGQVEPLTKLDTSVEGLHLSPFWLPDGRHFLFAAATSGSRVMNVRLGTTESEDSTVLIEDATSNAMYAEGHVVYARDTTLMARPFDPRRLAFTGEAFVIAEQVLVNPVTGTAAFSLSQNGLVAYQTSAASQTSQLAWFDQSGKRLSLIGSRDDYGSVNLSPDGRSLAVTLRPAGAFQTDIWLFDAARGVRSRLTDGGAIAPVWSADGSEIVYARRRGGETRFIRRSASGVGPEEVVHTVEGEAEALSWSPDGKVLLYSVMSALTNGRLWAFSIDEKKADRVIGSNFNEVPAALSPDGRWLAYTSTESGGREVYVTSYPNPTGKWPVSVRGGDSPRWSRDGRHLFFVSSSRLMRAGIRTSQARVEIGEVTSLLDVRTFPGRGIPYDIAPDGRLLINVWEAEAGVTPITILQNWTALGGGG